MQDRKILVVEDDSQFAAIIRKMLTECGFEVRIADSGEQAIESLAQYTPDFVFMDVRLPGMDGYRATMKIKERPGLRDVPVIFLSGRSASEEGGRSFSVGGSMYLRKPIRKKQLQDVLSLVFGPTALAATARKENET